MGLRVSASITLGGVLNASTYRALCDVIEKEGLSLEWDGERFEAHHRRDGEPLRLHAHDVSWGRFDMLEPLCAAWGLPFVRWSGSHPGQFGAERVVFTGTGMPRTFSADDDDVVVIVRETVETLASMAAVLAYFDAADFTVPPLVVEGSAGRVAAVPEPVTRPTGDG